MKSATCPRCGMTFSRLSKLHMQLCRELPLPTELAEDFLKSKTSFSKWAQGYSASITMLRPRVAHGLVLLGHDAKKIFEEKSKQRPKLQMTACPRCGVGFRNLTDRHRRVCQELPLPVEMAENFLEDNLSFEQWSKEYNVSINLIRVRVVLGLESLGHDVRAVFDKKRKLRSVRGQRISDAIRGRDENKPPLCSGCTIMLKPEQVERGLCEYCAGEVFDYMEAVTSEYPAGSTIFTAG